MGVKFSRREKIKKSDLLNYFVTIRLNKFVSSCLIYDYVIRITEEMRVGAGHYAGQLQKAVIRGN